MFQNVDNTEKQERAARIFRNKWAIAAVVLFAVCAVLALYLPASPLMFIPFGCSIAATLYCVYNIKDREIETPYRVVFNRDPLDLEGISDSLTEGFEVRGLDARDGEWRGYRSYVASAEFDEALVSKPLKFAVATEKFQFEDLRILPYTSHLKEHRNFEMGRRGAQRPDKAVIGLDSDLDLAAFDKVLKVVPVSRHAVQVTDDAFSKLIVDTRRITNKVVYSGRQCCLGENGELLGIDAATNTNQLDVCVLAITSDGKAIIRRAGQDHPLCPGDLLPSAMSSVSPADIAGTDELQKAVVHAAVRKTSSIYKVLPGNVECSLVGYSRILALGASPEFYCIAKLDKPYAELAAVHTDDIATVAPVDVSASSAEEMVSSLESLYAEGKISISLDAITNCLRSALDRESGKKIVSDVIDGKGGTDA